MENKRKYLFSKDEVLGRIHTLRAQGVDIRADFAMACMIADNALLLQRDHGGVDYSHHTTRVSQGNAPDNILMIIGKLHDVVEDGDWTLDDLRAAGFSERIIAAVDAVTHREGERYFESIERVAANPDARKVKMADLRDNTNALRLQTLPDERRTQQLKRYIISYHYLSALEDGSIPAGTTIPDFLRRVPALDPGPQLWAIYSARPYQGSTPAAAPKAPAP